MDRRPIECLIKGVGRPYGTLLLVLVVKPEIARRLQDSEPPGVFYLGRYRPRASLRKPNRD